jgi:hypothetical protein
MGGGGGIGEAWSRVSILAAKANKKLIHFLPSTPRASVQSTTAARARGVRIPSAL